MHRGYEKLTEVRTYPQVTTLINRIDWLGSFANEVPFILAAEQLMDVEAPPRAQWIRTILFELSRIANVSLFLGDIGLQLGAHDRRPSTPSATASSCSTRSRRSPAGASTPTSTASAASRTTCPRAGSPRPRRVMDKHARLLRRDGGRSSSATRSSRPAPAASASSRPTSPCPTACRAPTSAASGVDWDLRRDDCPPGLAYDQVDWKVWTHPDGDCFARYWVRLQEIREATKIVDQLLDGLPSGPIMAKVPRIIKVPEGEAYVATENPLGEMGYYVVSKGDLGAVPGEDPLGQSSTTSRSCRGCCGASTCPTSSRSSASLYFILGDIDR